MAEPLRDHRNRPVVAVTGIGMISSLGVGLDENWKAVTAGKSGVHRITRFPTTHLRTTIPGTIDYLPGEVGHYPLSEAVRSDAALVSAARLLRRFHDASVPLVTRDLPWQLPALPNAEVIVHGDYAPYNLVFSGDKVVGIFDLDYARPGPRIHDISSALHRFAPLGTGDDVWGTTEERAARVRLFCASYGLDACSPPESVAAVVPRLLDHVSYMREEAAGGNEAFARHIAEGHADLYERDAAYVTAHLAELGG
jgi:hypothetical protein